MSNLSFPFQEVEAFKLHLMNLPYFHKAQTLDETKEMLKKHGDFLVQSCAMRRMAFTFAGCTFATLNDLINFFSRRENSLEVDGYKFCLHRPIYRPLYAGRFGYGEIVSFKKSTYSKNFQQYFVRSLRSEYCQLENVEEDLEQLLKLDHKYLVKLKDYSVVNLGAGACPLYTLELEAFSKNLFDHLNASKQPESLRQLVNWAYQAINYLMGQDLFHRRFHARACLLDLRNNLKISDIWTKNDCNDLHIFQKKNLIENSINESVIMYRDGWRYMPVETLLNGVFDTSSQIWSYALFIWQIFSQCRFNNRENMNSLTDFLNAGAKDDQFFLAGHLSRAEAMRAPSEIRNRQIIFYKVCETFPKAPDADIIPRALANVPIDRPNFSEVFHAVEKEFRIYNFSRILSKFI